MNTQDLYSFVYRGILTEAALDRTERRMRSHFGNEEIKSIETSLSFDLLDRDMLSNGKRMATVYSAIHAFENSVRATVTKAMLETHGDQWWTHVPERIRKSAKTRIEEDSKFRWHCARGTNEINYCDFGDLSSIIVTNWALFEDLLGNMEWAKAVLNTLEKSRNIVMHGGNLAKEDIERIGINIRDWIRQAG